MLGISEVCLISLAFVGSAVARLGVDDAGYMLNDERGILKIFVVSIGFVTCMYYFDLYDSSVLSNRREVVVRLIQVLGVAYVALGLLYYLFPSVKLGRGIFQIGFLFVGAALLLWRRLFTVLNSAPRLVEHVLIFGKGGLAESLQREIESRPELGFSIAGHAHVIENRIIPGVRVDSEMPTNLSWQEIRGGLSSDCEIRGINRILVTMEERRGKLPVDLLLSLKNRGVLVQDGNEVYEAITGKVPIESIRLGELLFSPGFFASRLFLLYKRFASIVISVIGLLISLPLLPFVVLAVKLTSPGPVLYQQKRVGRDGAIFYCFKFRTMRADAEADIGPSWAKDDDPRITRVGHFLRLSRLDEIPQLWNVLRGDMSLVGPRPERPEFVRALNQEIPYYYLRHSIRPGITGWAQICFRYGSSVEDAKEKLRYDLFYIKNMSAGLDLLIFVRTIKTILLGRGAR